MRWQWLGGRGEVRSTMQNKRILKSIPQRAAGDQKSGGVWRAVCVCWLFMLPVVRDITSSTHLLWRSFYQTPLVVSIVTCLLDPLPRTVSSGVSWLNVTETQGVGGKVQVLSAS